MKVLHLIKETILPFGDTEFRAHLSRMHDEEATLVRTLHLLDQPATQEVCASTDEAAEFPSNAPTIN